MDRLMRLEDRCADRLTEACITDRHSVIIAQAPRLWIDLNRAEQDMDPQMMAVPVASSGISQKARGGLGIVPTRLAGVGDIWREKLTIDELNARIEQVHRPYHMALARTLDRARARFGVAILIDLHSMPPLKGVESAQIVIGDCFGRAADSRLSESARAICEDACFLTALNAPYAGGYILERHGRPHRNVHALQIEVDRTLYLDEALDRPGKGLKKMQNLVVRLAQGLAQELSQTKFAEAAE